jgi:hypothetical protein
VDWKILYCPNRRCLFYGLPFNKGLFGSSHCKKQAWRRACGRRIILTPASAYYELDSGPAIFELTVHALTNSRGFRHWQARTGKTRRASSVASKVSADDHIPISPTTNCRLTKPRCSTFMGDWNGRHDRDREGATPFRAWFLSVTHKVVFDNAARTEGLLEASPV